MFTRFNGNVVPFADDSTSTNRTVFGGTTQSDLIDDNLNTNFKKGWEIVGLNDNPTREDFNAMGYTLGALTAYLYEMGISEWNASQNYRANSRVTGSDGKIYKSLTGTTGIPNVGKNPTTDTTNWVAEGSTDYSALTAKTTPVDADLIAIADSRSSFSLKKLSWADIKATIISSFGVMISTLTAKTTPVDADIFTIGDSAATNASKKLSWADIKATLKTYFDTLYFALTGSQTVGGIKTFTSSPIVPTPTTDTQVANKSYVDGKVDGKMVLGTKVQSTSGTSIDFTGIPNWAKRITIMFDNVSTAGASNLVIQIGSGSIASSGYTGSTTVGTVQVNYTAGFGVGGQAANGNTNGAYEINLISANTWVSTGLSSRSNDWAVTISAGSKTLSGVLDRVRITTLAGTYSFDGGTLNIMYEG